MRAFTRVFLGLVLVLGGLVLFLKVGIGEPPERVQGKSRTFVQVVTKLTGLESLPDGAYPFKRGISQTWFGEVDYGKLPFLFLVLETNGGLGDMLWKVVVENGGFDQGSIRTVPGKTRYLGKAYLEPPLLAAGRNCPKGPHRVDLSVDDDYRVLRTAGKVIYEGTCEVGTYRFVEGAVNYNPNLTYWACDSNKCYPIRNGRTGSPEIKERSSWSF